MQTQVALPPTAKPPIPPPHKPSLLDRIPAPIRGLLRPMLYASVGLHVLLLFVPFGAQDGNKPKLPKDQAVKVTQLPPTSKGAAKLKQNTQSVKVSPPISKLVRTPVTAIPAEPRKAPPPDLTKPEQKEAEKKTDPTEGLDPDKTPPPTVNTPFTDFPRYPGAIPGSGGAILSPGLDKQASQTGDDASAVINFYITEGGKKGFDIKPSSDQPGYKVFTVSKAGGAPQYLHLLAGGKGTVILLAAQEIPASTLRKLNIPVESPEEQELNTTLADDLITQVSLESSDPLKRPENAKFREGFNIDGFKSDIGDAYTIGDGLPMPIANFASLLTGALGGKGFTLSPAETYGNGQLYKVTKGDYTGFITLLSAPDGATAIFVWTKRPK